MKKIILILVATIFFNLFGFTYAGNNYVNVKFENVESFTVTDLSKNYRLLEEKVIANIFIKQRIKANQEKDINELKQTLNNSSSIGQTLAFFEPISVEVIEEQIELTFKEEDFNLLLEKHKKIDKIPIS